MEKNRACAVDHAKDGAGELGFVGLGFVVVGGVVGGWGVGVLWCGGLAGMDYLGRNPCGAVCCIVRVEGRFVKVINWQISIKMLYGGICN